VRRFVFVGEKRSATAIARGWTWESGRLCADTLHRALAASGLEPRAQTYRNAYRDDDGAPDDAQLAEVAALAAAGTPVVALGRRASRALADRGVPHRVLTHPAARGAIRKAERYRAHVAAVLR